MRFARVSALSVRLSVCLYVSVSVSVFVPVGVSSASASAPSPRLRLLPPPPPAAPPRTVAASAPDAAASSFLTALRKQGEDPDLPRPSRAASLCCTTQVRYCASFACVCVQYLGTGALHLPRLVCPSAGAQLVGTSYLLLVPRTFSGTWHNRGATVLERAPPAPRRILLLHLSAASHSRPVSRGKPSTEAVSPAISTSASASSQQSLRDARGRGHHVSISIVFGLLAC